MSLSAPKFPNLPLTNLGNAEFTAARTAFSGQNTVIDFWTTKCTNCPDALDRLNDLAGEERYKNIKFVSICCDSCDGARNIIEKEDSPRWEKVSHFFLDHEHKEEAKKVLGFKQVPFYVVLNEEGDIVQMGSKKYIDFEHLPGMIETEQKGSTDKKYNDNEFNLDMDF